LNFLDRYSKNTEISNFIKTPSSGNIVVPCGRTVRETDTLALTVAFRNFANAPEYLAHMVPIYEVN